MRTLIVVVLFLTIGAGLTRAQVPQIPDSVREEMKAEQPEYREAIQLAPFLAIAILYFAKANLWVLTKTRMVELDYWTFRDNDVELISREVEGKLIILYQKGEST